ncbi:MAG: hypothetical protein QF903_08560 [Planctomycetota bacterium]|jgi:hypothetical protein|nr:hypothetical protein [Planctomycetota bacterium]MDP6763118.1 hypothetical protein [Planctomycetota bacterium]MDP6989518.1 hypothetical protein [Planctomycetota bacterium]
MDSIHRIHDLPFGVPDRGARRATLPTIVLTLALAGCGLSPAGDTSPDPDLDLNGNWAMQFEPLDEYCQPTGVSEVRMIRLSRSGSGARIWLDLDGDDSFGENVFVQATIQGDTLHVNQNITWQETQVRIRADLRYVVWGYMTGTWSEGPQGCGIEVGAAAMRMQNPPLIDVSGIWHLTETVQYATGELEYLTGMVSERTWYVSQHWEGATAGLLQIVDDTGRGFLGLVNNDQVLLGRSFDVDGYPAVYTYTNLIVSPTWLEGNVLGEAQVSGGSDLAWGLEGWREAFPSNLIIDDDLEPDEGPGGSFALSMSSTDDVLQVSVARGERLDVELPAGPWRIDAPGAAPLPLVLRPGGTLRLPLSSLIGRE